MPGPEPAAGAKPVDQLQILFQDRHLLVVVKPAGMPSQPDKTGSEDLLTILAQKLGPASGSLLPVHRLDRPVAGLLVVARTPSVQAALTRQMGDRSLTKAYLAVVCGSPAVQSGELNNFLVKNERLNVSRVTVAGSSGAKAARLSFTVLASSTTAGGETLTLLRIQLETGRHHQIRVQMAHAGWPLWGDTKYNPAFRHAGGWHAIALVAAELRFQHPADGRRLEFALPMPEQEPFRQFYDKMEQ